jgi:MoaA/NifB/PqqE/SkfB family radical SAM enzyme
VKKIKELNASILLGFNSFDPDIQDKMVGNVSGYTLKRNRALELLVKAGLNKHNPTRIRLAANPVTIANYEGMLGIYKWGQIRSLSPLVCPTMISGRCRKDEDWKRITPSKRKLIDLATQIYVWNIKKGIQTLDQLKRDGISAYFGTEPCNQVSCGVYITLNGTVLRCPGDDVTIFGNVRRKSLKKIWQNCENYKRAGTFNCFCPPKDGKSIPANFYNEVLQQVTKHFS